MSPWLAALEAPLPGEPCGEDPRYWDDFALLKGEIEKLQGTDFALVWDLGRDLLAGRTRDLRIAGYLVPAGLFTGGFSRLMEAVRCYRTIAERYWDDCHPRQSAARVAALRWLNQPKIEALARRHAGGASSEEMERLQEEIGKLNGAVREKLGEDAPIWTVLNGWVQETLRPLPAAPPTMSAAILSEPSPVTVVSEASSSAESGGASSIGSDREVATATRAIRDHLRGEGQELHAAYFARALRWGGLASPPSEGGKTRIPPPRPSGRHELEKARAAGDWEGVLRVSESLFLEPGGQVDLDLQLASAEAARALGRHDLADFIAGEAALLVRRFPDLPRLAFEDGRPFASHATRQWLQERQGGAEKCAAKEGWEKILAERTEKAREALRRKRLEEGLAHLRDCPVHSERERFLLRLAQGRLCLEGGRPEIALPLLEELHGTMLSRSLHLWDQAVAMEVWTALLEGCQALGERDDLKRLASEVRGLICRTDPEKAAGLIQHL